MSSYVGLRVQIRVSGRLKERQGWPQAVFETAVYHETEKAYNIAHPLGTGDNVWIPRSHVQSIIELIDSRTLSDVELGPIPITRQDMPPWEHQLRAYHFAKDLNGAMLAFSMRGGKTRCTIDLLVNRGHQRTLIVAPAKIVESHVWAQELKKWCTVPFDVLELYDGSVRERAARAKQALERQARTGVPVASIVNYEAVWRSPMDALWLGAGLDCVVADECVPGDTLIDTPTGGKRIDELSVGDAVYGFDIESRSVVETTVQHCYTPQQSSRLVRIGDTFLTPDHPVYTEESGYVPADRLTDLHTVCYIESNSGREGDCDQASVSYTPNCLCEVRQRSDAHQENANVLQQVVRCKSLVRPTPGSEGRPEQEAEKATDTPVDVCSVREGVSRRQGDATVLREALLGHTPVRVTARTTRKVIRNDEEVDSERGRPGETLPTPTLSIESTARSGEQSQGKHGTSRARVRYAKLRDNSRDADPATAISRTSRLGDGVSGHGTDCSRERENGQIQDRHSAPVADDRGRSRRGVSLSPKGHRHEARRDDARDGMDNIAFQKRRRNEELEYCLRGSNVCCEVYNIETGTGNYFANGLLIRNCHRAKAPGGRASMFLGNLAKRVPYRIGLSGTPMGSSPLDVYGQYRFIDRNVFGANYALFKSRYAMYGGPGNHILIRLINEDELSRKFYSIAFRVTDEELDLPPALHITRTCQLSPSARRIYRDLENEFYAEVDSGEVTVANALTKIIRLQQVTSGYVALDDGTTQEIDTSKQDLLEELLDELGPQPAVIFCRFKHDLDAVAATCAKLKRSCAFLRGGVNQLAEWQAGEFCDLAVQIQSGREGVSFARAKVCIYYSTNHSLNDFLQAQKRIVLVGQKDSVAYYYLAVEKSIDTKIYAALQRKEDVVRRVLDRREAEESEE